MVFQNAMKSEMTLRLKVESLNEIRAYLGMSPAVIPLGNEGLEMTFRLIEESLNEIRAYLGMSPTVILLGNEENENPENTNKAKKTGKKHKRGGFVHKIKQQFRFASFGTKS
eukprot:Phypoly_transcript_22292.p1 GENE.Phypoly_transcript_22292~~Phypoly_transcript_22292.p1  ORF type:complete len:112 (+),score=5.46 Phypoly_transcript_22292:196-531(+)